MKSQERNKMCWNCDAGLELDATYCPFCGTDLLAESMESQEEKASSREVFANQSLEDSLASLYKPPYAVRDDEGYGVPPQENFSKRNEYQDSRPVDHGEYPTHGNSMHTIHDHHEREVIANATHPSSGYADSRSNTNHQYLREDLENQGYDTHEYVSQKNAYHSNDPSQYQTGISGSENYMASNAGNGSLASGYYGTNASDVPGSIPNQQKSGTTSEEKLSGWPLILLAIGGQLLTLALLLLVFSDNGHLVLEWNAKYWFVYLLAAAPFLTFGWKMLKNGSE